MSIDPYLSVNFVKTIISILIRHTMKLKLILISHNIIIINKTVLMFNQQVSALESN